MLISITDSDHGYWDPEEEECDKISAERNIDVKVKYQNCSQNNLVEKCQGSGVIAVSHLNITRGIVDQIPGCKVVTRIGVGLDNVEVDKLTNSGIKVVNFPTYCTEEVANHALSMILSCYRRLNLIRESQPSFYLSSKWGLMKGIRKSGLTTVGLLGLGRIGSQVAKRLTVCGFNVIACDPFQCDKHFDDLCVCRHTCESLFENSDILSIHCCLDASTYGLVDSRLLNLMKPESSIVNTARGKIVNSTDLKNLLNTGHLRMAYVDVFNPEPMSESDLSCNNLYVTPHVAFYSWDSQDWIKRETIRQSVKAFYDM